jgi:hypothetical protein
MLYYGQKGVSISMAKELRPVDVSKLPELLSIAEDVRASGVGRLLKRNGEELAILAPVTRRARKATARGRSKADYEALLAAAGSWKDVDTDAFVADVYESRRRSSRPPVEL